MISNIGNNNITFRKNELEYTHDTLLKNTPANRLRIGIDKFTNSLSVYPAKGLKGSKNANFYEFLTMGMVPYLAGSAMLMAVFNAANKHFAPFAKEKASALGKKMALGVVFYGLFKNISKSFVNVPIKAITGIDTERPYAKVIYELPDNIHDTDITNIEHHKVFESVEFPRWDLLYGDEFNGQKRNYRYDRIAKRLGLGGNLKDSDQEVKPRIKETVVKTNLAKNISSYLWAATGVALAFQEPWENFFNVMTLKFWNGKKFMKTLQSFGENFVKSSKKLWHGEGKGIQKHAGKMLVGSAVASTLIGIMNALHSNSKPSNVKAKDVIKGGYVVS